MSLSRPVQFPLLKLPFLCFECVIKNCDILDLIFFALMSRRTRRIVKDVKALNRIRIFVSESIWIDLGRKSWHIGSTSSQSSFDEYEKLRQDSHVIQNNAIPFYTRKTNYGFESYTDENKSIALKTAMGFLNELFKCSVERVEIKEDNFPESGDIGVKSTVNLCIDQAFSNARSLNLLLENLEVTGTCTFYVKNIEENFYCDPNLFKCKKLVFWNNSAAWVTREILMQFEVPQLNFSQCPFSVGDIVSFVTRWFHSDNKKFEYLYIPLQGRQVSLNTFQTEHLNPLLFDESNQVLRSESFTEIDFSVGIKLRRNDGLVATIHVNRDVFLFYIWHNQ